jgi:predicted AAA+ superfamily ATPase
MHRFDKQKIVSYLSAYANVTISPDSSLIVFDEIQASANALNALKYFKENANEYHVMAAGSLLGIKLAGQKSFPVGQVNFLNLYPMSFLEFLDALGKTYLRHLIEGKKNGFEPFPEPFHVELVELLKYYYFTGGMPEAVDTYFRTNSFANVRQIQKEIIDSYLLDFSKHAEKSDIIKISSIWHSMPVHLSKENKKFIFSAVRKSARARNYENALQWLIDAGILYKSYNVSTPKLPLEAYAKTDFFKIFLLDIGLLGAMSNISMDICHPFFTGIFLIDEVFYLLNISVTVQHQAMRFQPVPSGPSDFLVIAFNVFGQIEMNHETNIGFINPHAECNGSHDNLHIIPDKCFLVAVTFHSRQAGMVRSYGKSIIH